MKRKILFLTALILVLSMLSGCCLKHEWKKATCVNPKTCKECGKTEGEPLGHRWEDATCEDPETCSVCDETRGDPLDHEWEDATCETPKTCKECGETEGEALGHDCTITSLNETGYTGVCALCGNEVAEELTDWEAFAMNMAAGKWVGKIASMDGESNIMEEYGMTLDMEVDEDGMAVLSYGAGGDGDEGGVQLSFDEIDGFDTEWGPFLYFTLTEVDPPYSSVEASISVLEKPLWTGILDEGYCMVVDLQGISIFCIKE